jgi:hypothetical protein
MEDYVSFLGRMPFIKEVIDLLKQSKGTIEYEVRLGYFYDNFNPGLKKDDFFKLKRIFDEKYGKQEESLETVNYLNSGIRTVYNQVTKKTKVYRKDKVKNMDFQQKDLTFRVDLSLETNLFGDILEKPSLVKNRKAVSYKDPRGFHFDLRESLPNGPYEVEFEYDIDFLRRVIEDKSLNIFTPIMEIAEYLGISSFLPFNYLIKNTVMAHYDLYTKPKTGYIKKSSYVPIKKPVNLSHEVMKKLDDYYVMPKLDGVRYFLYFDYETRKTYLINDKMVMAYKKFTDISFQRCILDGELYNDEFYVFDVYSCDTKNMKAVNNRVMYDTQYRFNLMKDASDIYDFVKLTPYFNTTIEAITSLVSFYDYKTDGLVYIPKNGYYFSQNYKYKPPKELTIDFSLKKKSSNEYYVYSYGQSNVPVIFMGDSIIPFVGYITLENVKEGIYEMKWDYIKNTFTIIRERVDKTLPNFIGVAQNIWKDIMNPITVHDLIKETIPRELNINVIECFADIYFENKMAVKLESYKDKDTCVYIFYKDQKGVIYGDNIFYIKDGNLKYESFDSKDDKIMIDENFNLEELKWKKGEFVKQVFVDNYSALIDKEGYIVIELDQVERIYYKEFFDRLKGYEIKTVQVQDTSDIYQKYLELIGNVYKKDVKEKFISTLLKDFNKDVLLKSKNCKKEFLDIFSKNFYNYEQNLSNLPNTEKIIYEISLLIFNPDKFEYLKRSIESYMFNLRDAMKALVDNIVTTINNVLEECVEILDVRPYLIRHIKNIIIKIVNNSFFELFVMMKDSIRNNDIDKLKYKCIILSETYETNLTLFINSEMIFENIFNKEDDITIKRENDTVTISKKIDI